VRCLSSSCESANCISTKEKTRWLPTNTPRCGNIKATIWQNVSEKSPFFATTFSRPFKDKSGVWRNVISFCLNDLEALLTVAREAKEWITPDVLKSEAALWGRFRPSGGLSHKIFSSHGLSY
jgi:hypothetical protein